MINQTLSKLHSMNLKAMEEEYRRQLELSISNSLSFDERLAMMVDAQWLAKANSRLKRLLREANLGNPSASLEDLNYDPKRNLDKATIARLSDCTWIKEGKNLIITGATGTGKTYLISAFGHAACRKGLKVRSYKVNRLLVDLAISRGDGSYNRLLGELKKPDLLILDDSAWPLFPLVLAGTFWRSSMTAMTRNPSPSPLNCRWQNGMPSLRMLLLRMLYWIG